MALSEIPVSKQDALARMEACIADIKAWMLLNLLKLNDSKTEFLEFHPSPHSSAQIESSFSIGTDIITPTHTANNLGVVLDDRLFLDEHITATCKAANFQLYRLSRIKKFLSPDALKMAVHSLIASKLDYCNSVLVRLLRTQIHKFQHVMN